MDKEFDKLFKGVQDLNPYATVLEENTLSNIKGYIDTGCYSLNAILCGSLFGGVPQGRVTVFAGESGCGKTYILNKILGNAQRKGLYPVIFDTEVAIDKNAASGVGLDPKNTKYVPVGTIEDCKNQVMALLDAAEKNEKYRDKLIISIDSLGNLSSSKEIADSENNKSTMDMGIKAKQLKAFMRQITYKAGVTGTTVICSNHVYADPSALHPSIVKHQSGGSGPMYMASVVVQMAAKNEATDEKNERDEVLVGAKKYSGVTLKMLTTKNRIIPKFLTAEAYLNFKTGLDKYNGLKDLAVEFGVIETNGRTYTLDGESIGYYKNWRHDEGVWDKVIQKLEPEINKNYRYGKTIDEPIIAGEVYSDEQNE